MLDDADRLCDDAGHRVLDVTAPRAQARAIRPRLVSALGPGLVSRLRRVQGGREIVICRPCTGDQDDEPARGIGTLGAFRGKGSHTVNRTDGGSEGPR
jgi:hypothetical protein